MLQDLMVSLSPLDRTTTRPWRLANVSEHPRDSQETVRQHQSPKPVLCRFLSATTTSTKPFGYLKRMQTAGIICEMKLHKYYENPRKSERESSGRDPSCS